MSSEPAQINGNHESTQPTSRRDPQRDAQISAETTERWFFYPNQQEHPEYKHERNCQDRSLREFS